MLIRYNFKSVLKHKHDMTSCVTDMDLTNMNREVYKSLNIISVFLKLTISYDSSEELNQMYFY